MAAGEFLRRHWAVVLLAAAVLLYYPRFVKRPDGMTLFPLAAQCMLHEEPMAACAPAFTYPPVFAFVMIPFAPLPMAVRNVLWYAILCAATYLSFRLCERLALGQFPERFRERELLVLRVAAAALSAKVVLSVFENQAYDVVVFLLVLAGLDGLTKGRDLAASAGFALAAALKATPLLFLPYLALRRRWRAAVACLVLYAGFSLLPDLVFAPKGGTPGYFATWLRDIAGAVVAKNAAPQWWEGVNILNQSLRSLVFLLSSAYGALAWFPVALRVALAGYALLLAGLLLRSGRMEDPVALDGSLLVISMVMLSPMSSKSHFVVLMLPYMALSAHAIREPGFRAIGAAVLAASFALTTLTSRDVVGRALCDFFLSRGCIAIGTLVLLVFLAHVVLVRAREARGLGALPREDAP